MWAHINRQILNSAAIIDKEWNINIYIKMLMTNKNNDNLKVSNDDDKDRLKEHQKCIQSSLCKSTHLTI